MEEKDSLTELKEYIQILENFKLPDYKELSQIPLYMEQVVSYIEGALSPVAKDKTIITPFMVNNYVKAKIVASPENKKYDKDHIAYFLAISLLKTSCSMRDLATLIELDKEVTLDKQKLYNFFKEMHDEVLKNETHRVKVRLDTIDKDKRKVNARKERSKERSEESNSQVKNNTKEENLNLAYIALRLYVESETSKLIADSIMEKISKDVLPKEAYESSKKKADKYEGKKEHKEAKKLAQR